VTKLEQKYRYYNRKYFGNELPIDIKLRWAEIFPIMGYQLDDEIVLDRRDRRRERIWQFTLLHEMVHLSLPDVKSHHGEAFQRAMLRLAKLGAFKDLW
jgi:hypothetical protein